MLEYGKCVPDNTSHLKAIIFFTQKTSSEGSAQILLYVTVKQYLYTYVSGSELSFTVFIIWPSTDFPHPSLKVTYDETKKQG